MVPPSHSFGRTVGALRHAAGFSQEGFAAATGIHRTHMGTIERGLGNPTLTTIASIARVLRLSLTQLFEAVERGQVDAGPQSTAESSTKSQRARGSKRRTSRREG